MKHSGTFNLDAFFDKDSCVENITNDCFKIKFIKKDHDNFLWYQIDSQTLKPEKRIKICIKFSIKNNNDNNILDKTKTEFFITNKLQTSFFHFETKIEKEYYKNYRIEYEIYEKPLTEPDLEEEDLKLLDD